MPSLEPVIRRRGGLSQRRSQPRNVATDEASGYDMGMAMGFAAMKRWLVLACTMTLASWSAGETPPLYLLTYDHGGLVLWGPDHFRTELRRAMSWLDQYPNFKIGLDNEAYVYDALAEKDPALLDELRGDLRKYAGRFGIGTCTYGQPLSTFITDESNIRQIAYAIRADQERLGYTPSIYLMSEHAMHAQIPQILDGFGFKGAIMRTHFMMYGYNPTFDVPIGWWVGSDGSRIATIPTYPGEGGAFFKTTVDDWILTRYPSPEAKQSPADFRRQFQDLQPLLATRADDSSLRKEKLVQEFPGNADYRWILLDEIPGLFPAPTVEMATAPNDFAVRMPWGYCGNEIFNRTREAEIAVLTAERIAAAETLLGGDAHAADLDTAWKRVLLGEHHDIQICGLLADARRVLPASIAASAKVRDAGMRFVAARMSVYSTAVAQVTVFNPSSWRRPEWVEADMTLPKASATGIAIMHDGELVPSVVLKSERSSSGLETRVAFLADAPALGFAAYSVVYHSTPAPLPPRNVTIDVEHLRITTPLAAIQLDPQGGIASAVDVATGQPIFAAGRRSAFFAARIDGRDAESHGTWTLHTATGGRPWAIAREYGFVGGIPFALELRFRADTPRIDVHATFHFEGEKIGQLSNDLRDNVSAFVQAPKLRFKVFPARAANSVGVRDLPFTQAETTRPDIDGNYWTAVSDADGGLAFFNRGTMGSVREADGGFSMPLAYAMHYIWGTRMLEADFTYDFALEPFHGPWRDAALQRDALTYSFPLVVATGEPGHGALGETVTPAPVTADRDAIVTAMYPAAGGVMVRFANYSEREAKATVGAGNADPAVAVDLLGRGSAPADSPLHLRPWQFRTVKLTSGAGGQTK